MPAPNENTPPLLRGVSLWLYAVLLLPILTITYYGLVGPLPLFVGIFGLFFLFFWFFSLLFALYEKFVRRNRNVK